MKLRKRRKIRLFRFRKLKMNIRRNSNNWSISLNNTKNKFKNTKRSQCKIKILSLDWIIILILKDNRNKMESPRINQFLKEKKKNSFSMCIIKKKNKVKAKGERNTSGIMISIQEIQLLIYLEEILQKWIIVMHLVLHQKGKVEFLQNIEGLSVNQLKGNWRIRGNRIVLKEWV